MKNKKLAEIIRNLATRISPVLNTKLCYIVKFNRRLDLKNPITFTEKNSWLKLKIYNNSLLVKKCADKFRVREYINDKNCAEILNELYGVYHNAYEINWDKLPNQFVINC